MKVKVESVAGVEHEGKHFLEIEFSYDESSKVEGSSLVIRKSTLKVALPMEKFSEQPMLEALKKAWETRKGMRERVDKISKKILGKEYEV